MLRTEASPGIKRSEGIELEWQRMSEAIKKIMKEGDTVVELDQFKYTLSTFQKPLVEVRDSL